MRRPWLRRLAAVAVGAPVVALGLSVMDLRVQAQADRTTCALRGVLLKAQDSSTRNPIPPGLAPETIAAIEDQRRKAQDDWTFMLSLVEGPRCAEVERRVRSSR